MGRKLRVEEIRDDPRKGRVKVPEKIVSYVLGAAKKTRKKNGGRLEGGLRRIARLQDPHRSTVAGSSSDASNTVKRKLRTSPSKASVSHQQLFAKLNDADKEEFMRSTRRGFISLNIGTGCNRSRIISKSRLASAHRQWCDERGKPQILHCKSFSRAGPKQSIDSDCVIVDLSPLRITKAVMGAEYDVNDFLVRWKAQVATAAASAGMELRALLDDGDDDDDWVEYNIEDDHTDDCEEDEECNMFFDSIDEYDNEEDNDLEELEYFVDEDVAEPATNDVSTKYVVEMSEEDSWASQPISSFPVVSMGEFEGQRTNAKAMARELAMLWHLPEECEEDSLERPLSNPKERQSAHFASSGRGSRQKKDRKTESRRRRRNNSRDMDLFLF
jgi:hypothetical protein